MGLIYVFWSYKRSAETVRQGTAVFGAMGFIPDRKPYTPYIGRDYSHNYSANKLMTGQHFVCFLV